VGSAEFSELPCGSPLIIRWLLRYSGEVANLTSLRKQ